MMGDMPYSGMNKQSFVDHAHLGQSNQERRKTDQDNSQLLRVGIAAPAGSQNVHSVRHVFVIYLLFKVIFNNQHHSDS